MKLVFKDGYIELNQDGTETIVGECAHTYYFTLVKNFRNAGLTVEEIFKKVKIYLLKNQERSNNATKNIHTKRESR